MKFFIDTGDVGEVREARGHGPRRRNHHQPVADRQERPQVQGRGASRCASWSTVRSAPRCSPPTYDEMMAEAREWHKVHKNVVVKLPLIPEGLKAREHLRAGGHPHQRHALLLAQPGAARRQGGRQLHLAVHRPPRRHQRDRHGADREDRAPSTRTTTSRPRCWWRRCATRPTWSTRRCIGARHLHHPVQRHAAARQAPADRHRPQEVRRGRARRSRGSK